MGFDIPEPYVWDATFQVFYDDIDEEHKGLFKGIFDLAGEPGSAAKLATLVSAVKKHFATEEAKFKTTTAYTDVPTHIAAHSDFVSKIEALKAPVDAPTLAFAKDWLVNHIKGTDFGYKGKL